MTRLDSEKFTKTVDVLNETTRAKFGDYGFACGYLSQVVIDLYRYTLNDVQRQKLEQQFQRTIDQHAPEEV